MIKRTVNSECELYIQRSSCGLWLHPLEVAGRSTFNLSARNKGFLSSNFKSEDSIVIMV